MRYLMILGLSTLAAAPALAETVVLKSGERVVGKVVRYGDFVIVAPDADHPRILDEIMVDSVSPEPVSEMDYFLDLPPDDDHAPVPDLQHVRFYPSAKAKVRHLLELATQPLRSSNDPKQVYAPGKDPEKTRGRAVAALKAMGKPAEDELFSCVVSDPSDGNEDRVALAIECLKGAKPKGMEKRLAEIAMSDSEKLWRLASEELKRRVGKTPLEVLHFLTDKETNNWRAIRAAADVVEVIRDDAGIAAVVKTLQTRGLREIPLPHIPITTGQTQLDGHGHIKKGGMVVKDKEGNILLVRVQWLDEDLKFPEIEERIYYHLVHVLEKISGERFKRMEDVDDWWGTQPHPLEGADQGKGKNGGVEGK